MKPYDTFVRHRSKSVSLCLLTQLSVQTVVENNEKIFTELILSIKKRQHEVTELIRDQERTEVSRAERQLEQEIADLERRDTELDQFSHTPEHFHFKVKTLVAWGIVSASVQTYTLCMRIYMQIIVKQLFLFQLWTICFSCFSQYELPRICLLLLSHPVWLLIFHLMDWGNLSLI